MSSSSSYPGWAYLLAGIAMGLFIAFLVYLNNLPEQKNSFSSKSENSIPTDLPTFDFYTILPELEIVVPEHKGRKNSAEPASQKTDDSTSVQLSKNEVLVLQVGSFKDNQQADKLKASLALIGLEAHIQKVKVNNQTWHRVRVGPFDNNKSLNLAKTRLQENEIRSITLKIDG